MSRPLSSTCNPANNILLKITVPKRTGRKRKRGSNEPFTSTDHDAAEGDCGSISSNPPLPSRALSARALLRRLQDSVGKYEVEAVGRIERMHVFRGMFLHAQTEHPSTAPGHKHWQPPLQSRCLFCCRTVVGVANTYGLV